MIESKYTKEFLEELRALPLYRKVQLTQNRIIEWYQHFNGDVCISFSGGKDSTVLLHIARQIFPNIKAVFSNTGLEYPEIQAFVMKQDNVDIVRPKMQFPEVISTYGYPLISKEVAEAIYYARRIVPQADTERERERASGIGDTASWGTAQARSVDGREPLKNRLEMLGTRPMGRLEKKKTGFGIGWDNTDWLAETDRIPRVERERVWRRREN